MLQVSSNTDMKTLASCLNMLVKEGYTEDFKVTEDGLLSHRDDKVYKSGEIKVVNFYRFEGISDPADNAIVYVIETNDGRKGTLTDAYGPYADNDVEDFIKEVEEINKKTEK